MNVVIIDYGSGNLRSAAKAMERAARENGSDADVVVTGSPDVVATADRLVLPGVGAFADCKAGIDAIDGMNEAIRTHVEERQRPFLGICVGMQLMAERGLENGSHAGFGWIGGEVGPIRPSDPALKVPHMGWNQLSIRNADHPIFTGMPEAAHLYFVHSYALACEREDQRLATTDYGGSFDAVVGHGSIVGTQFHPEKSQANGLRLLANFLNWRP